MSGCVRAVGEFETAEDIKPVVVRSNSSGRGVRVEDIATIRDEFEDLEQINRSNGERSIDLVVIKKSSGDILKTVDAVQEIVEEYRASLPEGYQAAFTNDISFYVRRRLGIVVNNAWIGLGFVVVMLLIFLSPSVSIWTSLGIPFSLPGGSTSTVDDGRQRQSIVDDGLYYSTWHVG